MKKTQSLSLNVVVIAALLLVVLVVLIAVFTGIFSKETGTANAKIDCINKDTDNDGVVDLLDKCCTGSDPDTVGIDGCSPNQEKNPCKC